MADVVAGDGYSNVAVFHMVNAYGAGLADTFVQTIHQRMFAHRWAMTSDSG